MNKKYSVQKIKEKLFFIDRTGLITKKHELEPIEFKSIKLLIHAECLHLATHEIREELGEDWVVHEFIEGVALISEDFLTQKAIGVFSLDAVTTFWRSNANFKDRLKEKPSYTIKIRAIREDDEPEIRIDCDIYQIVICLPNDRYERLKQSLESKRINKQIFGFESDNTTGVYQINGDYAVVTEPFKNCFGIPECVEVGGVYSDIEGKCSGIYSADELMVSYDDHGIGSIGSISRRMSYQNLAEQSNVLFLAKVMNKRLATSEWFQLMILALLLYIAYQLT